MAALVSTISPITLPPQLQQLARLVSGQLPLTALVDMPPEQGRELCFLAVAQGVGPLLYRRCQQAGFLPALSRPAREALLASYAQTAGYNFMALEAAQQWTARLQEAGITGVWLKGLPLSLSIYDTPEMRPMVDIDVLVAGADRETALQMTAAMTSTPPVMISPDQAIHAVFQIGAGERIKLELHWSLIAPPASKLAPDIRWFEQQAMPLETGQWSLYTLTPEAHLLYLGAHAELAHGESQFRLLRYLDMHRLIETYAPLNWAEVLAQAARFRWTYALERALLLTRACFGTAIPQDFPARLAAHRPVDEDISLVQQRSTPGTKWERIQVKLQGEQGTGRVRLALALLFPPPAYIRWRYQVQGWRTPFYYPYRWFDVFREIARSR